jgi:hypothetical protein
MDEEAAYLTTSLLKLEKYIRTLPNVRGASELERAERESALALPDAVSEARRLANDAATADDSGVKLSSLRYCQEQLEQFREALLKASQYDLVDAVDVAQLSAMADQANDLIVRRIKLGLQ